MHDDVMTAVTCQQLFSTGVLVCSLPLSLFLFVSKNIRTSLVLTSSKSMQLLNAVDSPRFLPFAISAVPQYCHFQL